MSFLSNIGRFVGKQTTSTTTTSGRSVAKDRLSVILASQRGSDLLQGVDMEALQRDVLAVVQKHIDGVAVNRPVEMGLNQEGDVSLFEMSVELAARNRGSRKDSP